MAEIWYMEVDTETLDGKEPRDKLPIKECIDLLKLAPERWKCGPDSIPDIRTGNPIVDESGYVGVVILLAEDELGPMFKEEWKPGWYLSPLTIVGVERALASKK